MRDLPMPASPDQQDALALAAPRLRPALAQQRQFLVAADHRAQVAGRVRASKRLSLDRSRSTAKAGDRRVEPLS